LTNFYIYDVTQEL